jgi:hypothetical protein
MHDLSPVTTPGRDRGRSSPTSWRAYSDEGKHTTTDPLRTDETTVTSIRSGTIPMPRCTNKTTPHSGDHRYDAHHPNTDRQDKRTIPPTMGWDPWQGPRPRDLSGWRSALTPTLGVVALSSVERPDERRSGVATYYGYDAPGNLEMTTKTLWTPRCTVQLTSYRHGYNAATASTVALR